MPNSLNKTVKSLNSLTSEFVFSAPSYLRIITHGRLRTVPSLKELTDTIVTDGIMRIKEELKEIDYPMMISILFNAFTEKNYLERILTSGKFGFDRVYADSGGLQMITLGLTANHQAKQDVYAIQAKTDLAMCFDEIPIKNEKMVGRAGYLDKVFMYEDHAKCAKETCYNVMQQIDYFRKVESQTKVFFIVQGNTYSDMSEWFEIATKTIPKDYWDHIGGLAIGGVCLGYGQREDVEKIAIYRQLRDDFGVEYTKKHLHILGVGSVMRLQPLIILRNTGLVPEDTHVSYDSTTLSMAYTYGNFMDKDGDIQRDTPLWEKNFRHYYDTITPIYLDYGYTQDEIDSYYNRTVKDMLCHEKIYSDHEDDRLRVFHHCFSALSNVHQIINFTHNLYRIYKNWDKGNDPIGMLKVVKSIDDFYEWEKVYGPLVPSKRLTRKRASLLEELVDSRVGGEKVLMPKVANKRSKATLSDFWEE